LLDDLTARWDADDRAPAGSDAPQLAQDSRAILVHMIREANDHHVIHIGAEHLLLGVLDEPECAASQVLRARGLNLKYVRAVVEDLLLPWYERPVSQSGRKSDVVVMRLDAQTRTAVDALVEAGSRFSRFEALGRLLRAGIESCQQELADAQMIMAAERGRELQAEDDRTARE
jgi:hypothetical protein